MFDTFYFPVIFCRIVDSFEGIARTHYQM